jgi:hypothetical protein
MQALVENVENTIIGTIRGTGEIVNAARQAMEGTIEGASSVGVRSVDAIAAAASGAIPGVGNLGHATTETA